MAIFRQPIPSPVGGVVLDSPPTLPLWKETTRGPGAPKLIKLHFRPFAGASDLIRLFLNDRFGLVAVIVYVCQPVVLAIVIIPVYLVVSVVGDAELHLVLVRH